MTKNETRGFFLAKRTGCSVCKKISDTPFTVAVRENPLTGARSYSCSECEKERWLKFVETHGGKINE